MFDYLVLRWKLAWLARGRRQVYAKFDREIAEARQRRAKRDEIRAIEENRHHERREFDEEVYELHTRYLFAEANRLIIPTAEFHAEEAWEEGPTGKRHLILPKINQLRALIRAEKKAGREQFLMWVPAITALTGLAGAAIGVIAAWFGFGSPK